MTKFFLCAKIVFMKVFNIIKSKLFYLTLLTVGLILSLTAFGGTLFASADTTEQFSASLYLPSSQLEFTSLSNPTEAYSDDEVTAIIQDNTSLLVSYKGSIKTISSSKIMDVKRFDQNSIIFSADSDIYKVTLNDESTYVALDNNRLTLNNNNGKSVSYFDKNDNYLITAYQDSMQVYKIENGEILELTEKDAKISIKDGTNVAINNNNEIFYVSNDGIWKTNVSDLSSRERITSETPTRIIANINFVYGINDAKIYQFPIEKNATSTPLQMTDVDKNFDLGNLTAFNGISFRGENLLITDVDNVQEFAVSDNNLIFTGFAVAKGKTAFNRITNNAIDVEKYNDTVAVLDTHTLTVFNVNKSNPYDRKNFNDYREEITVENVKPDAFALGNGTALLSYAHGTSSGSLRYLTFGQEVSDSITLFSGNVIHDVTYQSGYYYVLADNGMDSSVYRASEGDFDFTQILALKNQQFEHLTVDVYGNVYLSTYDKIIKIEKSNNYEDIYMVVESGLNNIKKMSTDLGGGLFVQDDSKIYYIVNSTPNLIEVSAPSTNVKSFALNFIEKEVFFIYNNEEYVCASVNMPNLALSEVQDSPEYVTTAENAMLENLKIYSAKDGANVYKVEKTMTGFNFDSICDCNNTYVYICTITESNAFNQSVSLYALASDDHIAFIDALEAVDVTESTLNKTDAPQVAYVATDVSGYFFPIITTDGKYTLTKNSNVIRLDKYTQINPNKTLTFLDKDFYFASFEVDGITHTGYVPKDFTTEVLSEYFTWPDSYTEKVNKTTLFSDKNMSTAILELSNGQTVTVLNIDNDVAYVLVSDGNGGVINGYISVSAIKNDAGTAVRNILIVLSVAACVCGTAVYFVTRKKKD